MCRIKDNADKSECGRFGVQCSSEGGVCLVCGGVPILRVVVGLPFLITKFKIGVLFFTLGKFKERCVTKVGGKFRVDGGGRGVPFGFRGLSGCFEVRIRL